MIRHTFFNKCNTILENSEYNTGFNPVAELNAGDTLSRILIHFDLSSLKEDVLKNGVEPKNLKHILKMTNAASINIPSCFEDKVNNCSIKTRAASFDIIAFKIPFAWDEGRGFDYYGDYVKDSHRVVSKDGSNWFQAKNGVEWDEHGVYFNKTLNLEYNEKFLLSKDSIIINEQHFDNGTENLEIDVTDFINDILINDKKFYGIGLSFLPKYEIETIENKFVSFFTNHTNTFFHPYLETINNEVILDNRFNFHIGSKNKLYFFAIDNGEYFNLDEMPTCTINDVSYPVVHCGKGVYYAEVSFNLNEIEPDTILYDIWGNIKVNDEVLNDVEMEFVVLPFEGRVTLGKYKTNDISLVPQLYGINDNEKVSIGDIREVYVDFIEEYSYGKKHIPQNCEYRLYVKEGKNEIDVFKYSQIERKADEYSILVNTNELIPNDYYIDIKIKQGKTIKYFINVLHFTIANNVTDFKK